MTIGVHSHGTGSFLCVLLLTYPMYGKSLRTAMSSTIGGNSSFGVGRHALKNSPFVLGQTQKCALQICGKWIKIDHSGWNDPNLESMSWFETESVGVDQGHLKLVDHPSFSNAYLNYNMNGFLVVGREWGGRGPWKTSKQGLVAIAKGWFYGHSPYPVTCKYGANHSSNYYGADKKSFAYHMVGEVNDPPGQFDYKCIPVDDEKVVYIKTYAQEIVSKRSSAGKMTFDQEVELGYTHSAELNAKFHFGVETEVSKIKNTYGGEFEASYSFSYTSQKKEKKRFEMKEGSPGYIYQLTVAARTSKGKSLSWKGGLVMTDKKMDLIEEWRDGSWVEQRRSTLGDEVRITKTTRWLPWLRDDQGLVGTIAKYIKGRFWG